MISNASRICGGWTPKAVILRLEQKGGGEINRCCGVLWFLVVVGSKTVRRYESYVVVRRIDAKVPRYVPRTSWSQMVFPPVPQRWDSQGYMGHTDPAPAPQKRVYPAPIRQSGSLVSCARGPFRLGARAARTGILSP